MQLGNLNEVITNVFLFFLLGAKNTCCITLNGQPIPTLLLGNRHSPCCDDTESHVFAGAILEDLMPSMMEKNRPQFSTQFYPC